MKHIMGLQYNLTRDKQQIFLEKSPNTWKLHEILLNNPEINYQEKSGNE